MERRKREMRGTKGGWKGRGDIRVKEEGKDGGERGETEKKMEMERRKR